MTNPQIQRDEEHQATVTLQLCHIIFCVPLDTSLNLSEPQLSQMSANTPVSYFMDGFSKYLQCLVRHIAASPCQIFGQTIAFGNVISLVIALGHTFFSFKFLLKYHLRQEVFPAPPCKNQYFFSLFFTPFLSSLFFHSTYYYLKFFHIYLFM